MFLHQNKTEGKKFTVYCSCLLTRLLLLSHYFLSSTKMTSGLVEIYQDRARCTCLESLSLPSNGNSHLHVCACAHVHIKARLPEAQSRSKTGFGAGSHSGWCTPLFKCCLVKVTHAMSDLETDKWADNNTADSQVRLMERCKDKSDAQIWKSVFMGVMG